MDESRLVNLLIGSGLVVVGATATATTRVHEEVGDGRQIQSQVLGDRLLHFSRGALGLAEDSLKSTSYKIHPHTHTTRLPT